MIKNIKICVCCLALSLISSFVLAQDGQNDEKRAQTFALTMNFDNAFGFYPGVYGSFGLNKKLSASYYSILWTNPSYGTPALGSDLWLETGGGINYTSFDKGLVYLSTTLGFTHGKLLSGGNEGVIGDGIVPGAFFLYVGTRFEVEAAAYYYKSLRKEGPITNDFILYWAYPGVYVYKSNISLGAHYEQFALTRTTGGSSDSYYQFLGAYLKFTSNKGHSFRLAMGKNFSPNYYSNEYYKATLFINL